VSLLVVSAVVFVLVHLAGGSPVDNLVGPEASAELHDEISRSYGLDLPLPAQYVVWLGHVVRGDLGRSIVTGQAVITEIAGRSVPTLVLATAAMLFGLAVGLPMGIVSAHRRGRLVDRVLRLVTSTAIGIPSFVLAMILIILVAVNLRVLPTSGSPPDNGGLFGALPFYVLPIIALGVRRAADVGRLFRSTLLDVLSQDYLTVARAKGLTSRAVLLTHATPNALVPVITLAAIDYAYLLGGAVVIETIFGLPGMGTLLVSAVGRRDFPVVQGILLFVAIAFIVFNLVADLLHAVVDPRAREA
jgi:peptide/nickel transport system permease protein